MVQALFMGDGHAIDLVLDSDVEAQQLVIVGNLVMVARSSAKAGTRVSLATSGLFALPKPVGTQIPSGARCFWSEGEGGVIAETRDGAIPLGLSISGASADAESVDVLLR